MNALEIVATGIVCPVGLSSTAAYTAICANVSAFAEQEFVLGGDDFEAVIGSAVPLRPSPRRGQEGARLERLARLALEECLMGAGVPAAETAVLIGVAEPHRIPTERKHEAAALLQALRTQLGIHPESTLLALGNAAAFDALRLARQLLASGRVRCCVVGGVDSLLNEHDIGRLQETYRIRTDDEGQGLVPGEAAGFVAVMRGPVRHSLATIAGVGMGREGDGTTVISEGHPTGRGLVQAWKAAVEDAGAHEREVLLRVTDMTGERYAGVDAMIAVNRYYRTRRSILPVWHPAENVGATGAAAGGLGLAIAALALARRFPNLEGAIMCDASSEAGLRGAALLRPPQQLAPSLPAPQRPRVRVVLDEHAEEAAFLFDLRQRALDAPHYDLRALTLLDARIRTHLDGLLDAGEAGFRLCAEVMAAARPGELTAAAVLAYTAGNASHIDEVLGHVTDDRVAARSIIAALAFMPWQLAQPHVQALSRSTDALHARIGIRAAAAHRNPLVQQLPLAPARVDAALPAHARALGEIGARQMLSTLDRIAASDDPETRFEAIWAATLLGARPVSPRLMRVAETHERYALRALDLAALALPRPDGQRWLASLSEKPDARKRALQLAGRLGDVHAIPWLIEHLSDPELAPIAGESFTLITGIDLVEAHLDRPVDEERGPNDDPDDEDVALDGDDELPVPDATAVRAHWEKQRHRFQPGQRYLCGRGGSDASLREVLRDGTQRQRSLAALALAIAQPGQPLFETRAPAERQATALELPRYWTI